MRIAVGSTNPVKVTAVQTIVSQLWPEAVVTAVSVATGVSHMPLNDDETITGARNRARAARAAVNADLGFGLEGGVHPDPIGLVLQGWVVVTDGNGREGIGGAGRLRLPAGLASRVLAGEELGPVMDELLGEANVKAKGGAVGALTGGLVPRAQAFALGVAYALAPFVAPEFYDEQTDSQIAL
ncbi:MAG: inosine/xanthosine triphosphatase [Chloroflexi bacterium]|nr:inosine/xanthosine triphosphatase [Chloroflexota bacterium]